MVVCGYNLESLPQSVEGVSYKQHTRLEQKGWLKIYWSSNPSATSAPSSHTRVCALPL